MPPMITTVSASRNKPFKINGHNDAIPPRDRIHPSDSPKLSPQTSFRSLDDAQPHSSSEDDHSDLSADESGYQGPIGNTTMHSLRERMADEFDLDMGSEFSKGHARSSSMADLDLSIIVAVIAPLVNWLTGTDQIKNLFLILFLIIYLHQLVQVPWELYHAARQRRPHPSFRSLNLPEREEETAVKAQMRLAEGELQRHEFAYLFVSMITPFAGAALLRTVLGLVNGVDSISWFSTTLFVLAAGIRPWGHLISRLRERTTSLHDNIHYPSPDTQFIATSRLQAVVERMNRLEQELLAVKRAMAMRAYMEEIHDDLNSALQGTERAIRKQERKSESLRIAYDARFAALEKAISRIERARGERPRGLIPINGNATSDDRAYSRLEWIFASIFRFMRALANSLTFDYFDPPSLPASPSVPTVSIGARPPLHHTKTPSRLETIEEDEAEPATTVRLDEKSRNPGHPDNGILLMVHSNNADTAGACDNNPLRQRSSLAVDVVSLPYRLAVGILVAISPPLKRIFK